MRVLKERGVQIVAHATEVAGITAQTCDLSVFESNPVRCADPVAAKASRGRGILAPDAINQAFAPGGFLQTYDLRPELKNITAPTLIVTTHESGLQSVEAVRKYAKKFPNARVIVMPGDSYHVVAVEPELCAKHALGFMQAASRRIVVTRAAS